MNSQNPLRILLIDKDPERASQVREALRYDGHEIIRQRPDASGLTAAVARDQPDIVIIDVGSPDRDTPENMSAPAPTPRGQLCFLPTNHATGPPFTRR